MIQLRKKKHSQLNQTTLVFLLISEVVKLTTQNSHHRSLEEKEGFLLADTIKMSEGLAGIRHSWMQMFGTIQVQTLAPFISLHSKY